MSAEFAVPEDLFDGPLPENDTQRATLARELRFAEGFNLIVAVCNNAEERARQIATLRQENSDLRLQEVPVRREIPHLLDLLRATLDDPVPDAVFVYGMENWIRGDVNPRSVPFILNLNAARNHFLKDCPCPLVLWIPDYLLGMIIRGAPDFASVRSGLYVFRVSEAEAQESARTLQSLGLSETLGLSLDEKQARLKELTELLARVRNLPEDRRNPQDELYLIEQLANLYQAMGRYADAEELITDALARYEQMLGPEHPETATGLNALAGLFWDQGRYSEAEPLYLRALAIRESALGPEHPDTAESLNNLVALYGNQGRYAEAEPLLVRSLAIREKALGPEHPDTAQSLHNLAALYSSQGHYAEAEPLCLRALAIRERALGTEHPDTAESLNNLALLYQGQGHYAESEPLYERALAILRKALGSEHPRTKLVAENLSAFKNLKGQ